jgi:pantoate--beta-alanine ligase
MIGEGERDATRIRSSMAALITRESVGRIDYISIADPGSLRELAALPEAGEALVSLAVRFGSTRLIDNCVVVVVQKDRGES